MEDIKELVRHTPRFLSQLISLADENSESQEIIDKLILAHKMAVEQSMQHGVNIHYEKLYKARKIKHFENRQRPLF